MELTIKIEDKEIYKSLMQFLKSIGIKILEPSEDTEKKISNMSYPLAGTLLQYDCPFSPATDNNNWEAIK